MAAHRAARPRRRGGREGGHRVLSTPRAGVGGEVPTSLLAPAYRWAAVAMVSLIFLVAFESLAVTTVMATVVDDLDGRAYFSVAFSATLAASVVGMVATGVWSDRRGAVPPLLAAVGTFVLGLLLAGLAPSIELFVVARFVQGLGVGGVSVALYVLVAQTIADVDRPRVFAAFAAAWVLPSLVGPPVAGVVATTVGWRWVFLGVIVLSAGALAMLGPTLRDAGLRETHDEAAAPAAGRLALAVAVALAVVLVDLGGRLGGPAGTALAVGGIAAALLAVRPLLPVGALRAGRGLPAVVLLRGLLAAAFFATEVHVPYLLQTRYDAPPWLAGLALTVGALGWAGASQVQGRLGPRLGDATVLRTGPLLLLGGLAGQLVVVAAHAPAWLVPLAWVLAGAGMGLTYPRISTTVLAASSPADRGRNTSAATISDAVGASAGIAVAGLVFTAVGEESWAAFTAVLVLTVGLAALAAVTGRRTTPAAVGPRVGATR